MRHAIAGAGVRGMQDAVEHRVAQVDVAGRHVDLGAQHAGAIRELAGAHPAQQVQVLLGRAIAVGAIAAGLGQRAAVGADLLGRQVVDIGVAVADQVLGPFVQVLEVIRGEIQMPPQSKPSQRTSSWIDSMYSALP